MANERIQLEIQGTSNFTFDVEGEWTPLMEPEYRAGNPTDGTAPRLTQIREVWTFRGCRIRSSSGSVATLWTEFLAFRARIESASAHPTYVRLVRDPSGDNSVLLTLGPSTYEDLQFESIENEIDPQSPAATWQTTATFTFVVSAVRKLADANGIVTFNQTVDFSYPNGQRFLEWRTRLTTKEGVSAITKAQSFARIPVSELGGDHSYETNGPDGIDYISTNADEQNSRVPTEVEVVSRVRQWGVSTGVTAGQGSPSQFGLVIVTDSDVDETVITTTASATGPNAKAWVLARKPSGATETKRVDAQAVDHFSIEWVRKKRRTATSDELQDVFKIRITGGKRAQLWRAVTGGHPPHHSEGGFSWLHIVVDVTTFGTLGGDTTIQLPSLLQSPYIFDPNASEEGEAEIVGERQTDTKQQQYSRSARLVFRSATSDVNSVDATREILEKIGNGERVRSYFIDA